MPLIPDILSLIGKATGASDAKVNPAFDPSKPVSPSNQPYLDNGGFLGRMAGNNAGQLNAQALLGSASEAQKAQAAQALQELHNKGTADVANIGEAGQDRRLSSNQAWRTGESALDRLQELQKQSNDQRFRTTENEFNRADAATQAELNSARDLYNKSQLSAQGAQQDLSAMQFKDLLPSSLANIGYMNAHTQDTLAQTAERKEAAEKGKQMNAFTQRAMGGGKGPVATLNLNPAATQSNVPTASVTAPQASTGLGLGLPSTPGSSMYTVPQIGMQQTGLLNHLPSGVASASALLGGKTAPAADLLKLILQQKAAQPTQ